MIDYLYWLMGQLTGELSRYQKPRPGCVDLAIGDLVRIKDHSRLITKWMVVGCVNASELRISLEPFDGIGEHHSYQGYENLYSTQISTMKLKAIHRQQDLFRDDVVLGAAWQ